MMRYISFKPQERGFTITELLMALGLTTIVGLGVFQVLMNTSKMSADFGDKMESRIEAKLGDKLLVRDLRAAGASLNNIYAKDDNGNNFFDFDKDRSSTFYRSQSRINRVLTLQRGGTTQFYFMVFDDLRGKGLFADPITFFEVGTSPSAVNSPASLTYRGINYNNYLNATDASGNAMNNSALISSDNLGKLVLVDSSSLMPTTPARAAVFIGKTAQSGSTYDIVKIANASIPSSNGTKIWNYDIRTPVNTTVTPTTFEQFMYYLPPLGTNGASVRIKPVRIFLYKLDCVTDPADCILYRQDVLHGVSTQQMQILRGFSKVIFTRSDIATSVFEVATEK